MKGCLDCIGYCGNWKVHWRCQVNCLQLILFIFTDTHAIGPQTVLPVINGVVSVGEVSEVTLADGIDVITTGDHTTTFSEGAQLLPSAGVGDVCVGVRRAVARAPGPTL